jgi:ketosteroid isomerase-like protein
MSSITAKPVGRCHPKLARFALICSLVVVSNIARAEDPAHDELRKMRTDVIQAIEQQDIDRVLTHLHPEVVVTWQNGEVCRGHAGVRDFFERMGKRAFRGYKVPPTPSELTIMHDGDAGISYGKAVGQFQLLGRSYEFTNYWTATMVKHDDKWLLAGYHVSWNALDNPLLTGCKRALYIVAPLVLLAGMIFGAYIAKRKISRQTHHQPDRL